MDCKKLFIIIILIWVHSSNICNRMLWKSPLHAHMLFRNGIVIFGTGNVLCTHFYYHVNGIWIVMVYGLYLGLHGNVPWMHTCKLHRDGCYVTLYTTLTTLCHSVLEYHSALVLNTREVRLLPYSE